MEIYKVIKRSGKIEDFDFNHILERYRMLAIIEKPIPLINADWIISNVSQHLYNNIKTSEIDNLACIIAMNLAKTKLDCGILASRITISSFLKNLGSIDVLSTLKRIEKLLDPKVFNFMWQNAENLNKLLKNSNNYRYTLSGFELLKSSHYLLSNLESPDFATLRVCCGLYQELDKVMELYEGLSSQRFTLATPTLLNSGFKNPQLSSCSVFCVNDSLHSIFQNIGEIADCQKYSSGIGSSWGKVRSKNCKIEGTNGSSDGIPPFTRIVNEVSKTVNQGGGKRPGSHAIAIPVWHPDFLPTIRQKDNRQIKNAENHHILLYACWISDHFMRCVKANEEWYFINEFGPECLENFYDEERITDFNSIIKMPENELFEKCKFTYFYLKHVKNGKFSFKMRARDVAEEILKVMSIAGVPYITFKDTVNRLRTQDKMIHSLNLCVEVTVPADDEEIGVCNLSSISVKKYFKKVKKPSSIEEGTYFVNNKFDQEIYYEFKRELLEKDVKLIVRTMSQIIKINYYPLEKMRNSNFYRRPIGIGIMGFADLCFKLGIKYDSVECCQLTSYIQEAIYYFALKESCIMAEQFGSAGGMLDFVPHPLKFFKLYGQKYKSYYNFAEFEGKVPYHSILTCRMPTGNTSKLLGNSPSFEPYSSLIFKYNLFTRETIEINKYFVKDALKSGIEKIDLLMQRLSSGIKLRDLDLKKFGCKYENELKEIYLTAFEISPMAIINCCEAAQPYIDQAQSMNLFDESITTNTFKYFAQAWLKGLKTGCYYFKTESANKEFNCANCVI